MKKLLEPWITVHVNRDSVCMGDDVMSHQLDVYLPLRLLSIEEKTDYLLRAYPLASISGGKATWVMTVNGREVIVVAQQWKAPQYIINDFEYAEGDTIHFKYLTQENPEHVLHGRRRQLKQNP